MGNEHCDCHGFVRESPPCGFDRDEPLPSVIQNFIAAFFGTLTVNRSTGPGEPTWTWTLPCDLDTGIPGYPRVAGEGLACYFARILSASVTGFNGLNAFATTTADATQPAINATVTIPVDTVGCFAVGEYVWLSTGGFYTVSDIDTEYNTLTLLNAYGPPYNLGVGGDIPEGTKVLPSGAPPNTGPQGPQGNAGASGVAGPSGPSGLNSFSTLSASFLQPAVGSSVTATVNSTLPYQAGQYVFIAGGGWYYVQAVNTPSVGNLTLENLFPHTPTETFMGNAPGPDDLYYAQATVPSGQLVISSGVQGPTGAQGNQPVQFWTFNQPGDNTWVPTVNMTVNLRVYGAGGGGGSGSTSDAYEVGDGGGGGGGAYSVVMSYPVIAGQIYTIHIGAGGAGGTVGNNGLDGSQSRFLDPTDTVVIYANGGSGGQGGNTPSAQPGAGGTTPGSFIQQFPGSPGFGLQGGPCGRDGQGGLGGAPVASDGNTPGGGGGGGEGEGYDYDGAIGGKGGNGQIIIEVVPAT